MRLLATCDSDPPGSFLAALGPFERVRLLAALPGHSVDLGQNTGQGGSSHFNDDFHTLTHHVSLVWMPPLQRWLAPCELSTSQGWPIGEDIVAAMGLPCLFSRVGGTVCESRSRRSQAVQTGNAIHVNSIGSIIMAIVCMYPNLLRVNLARVPVVVADAPGLAVDEVSTRPADTSAVCQNDSGQILRRLRRRLA